MFIVLFIKKIITKQLLYIDYMAQFSEFRDVSPSNASSFGLGFVSPGLRELYVDLVSDIVINTL